ncbi:MAG: endonuclease domain-containing protein [Oscillospiraceae bacterium]|nr:endonuclease domain-containing protein [Oscillospiraceae bacterium]
MEQNRKLTPLSQQLRKNQTKEENLLWYNFLRHYPIQFRRQYKIGNYIVDFYCHKAKLAIELDGSQHYELSGIHADAERTSYLNSLGILVLRFSNLDILRQFQNVCEYIDLTVNERTRTALSKCKQ